MTVDATTTNPPQDRIERLADRVLAVAKNLAAHSHGGRTFTVDGIYESMPDINRQRISDALKTLKDARRIHAIGRSKGIYEVEESYPPARRISVSTLTDGWRLLEIGEEISIAVTPQESAIIGNYSAGDAVRLSMSERMRAIESALAAVQHENAQLKQSLREKLRAVAAQEALPM